MHVDETMTVDPCSIHAILAALACNEGMDAYMPSATSVYIEASYLEKGLGEIGWSLADPPKDGSPAPNIFHADSPSVTRIQVIHLCWLLSTIEMGFGGEWIQDDKTEVERNIEERLGWPGLEAYRAGRAALRDLTAPNEEGS